MNPTYTLRPLFLGLFASFSSLPTAFAAVTLDFENLLTSSSGGVFNGPSVMEDGFEVSTPATSGIVGNQDGWQNNRGSSNGTTYASFFGSGTPSFTISPIATPTFNLISIDLAELFNNGDFGASSSARSVSFVGSKPGGGTVSQGFTLDLVSDGPGGSPDFETVLLSPDFSGLSSVTVSASSGASFTYLAFDDIVLEGIPVPEPATMLLFGTGALFFLRRKRT